MARDFNLTPKQRKFCLEFRKNNGNQKLAAIAAGYSVKTADAQASKLVKKSEVQKYITQLAEDAKRKTIMSIDERQEVLTAIARDSKKDDDTRIRAIDILNKMDGNYLVKVDVNVNANLAAKVLAVMAKAGDRRG